MTLDTGIGQFIETVRSAGVAARQASHSACDLAVTLERLERKRIREINADPFLAAWHGLRWWWAPDLGPFD